MADARLFQTILCPIDFSDHSRQALAYAALLASRSNGRLVVIFVEDPLLAAAAAVAYDEKTLIDKGRKELRRFVERTIAPYDLPMSSVTLDVAVGRPHEEIEWTAERLGCDVIVMGAHGRTGANKLMLGSTTHRILRRSSSARARHAARQRTRARPGQGLARQAGHCARSISVPAIAPYAARCGRRRARARHPTGAGPRRRTDQQPAVARGRRRAAQPSAAASRGRAPHATAGRACGCGDGRPSRNRASRRTKLRRSLRANTSVSSS